MRTGVSPVAILLMIVMGLILSIVGVVLLIKGSESMGVLLIGCGVLDLVIGVLLSTRVGR